MRARALGLAAGLMMAGAAAAADTPVGVAFAGGSAGGGLNGYAGAVVALPGARLGKGLGVRVSVNGGRYRYAAAPAIGTVRARYAGGDAALVYMASGDWGWTNLSAGPRVTDTSLSPNDPDNDLAGTRWDLGLQADGMAMLGGAWRLSYLGSVGATTGAYLVRAGIGPVVDPARQLRVGVEGALQGDPRYRTKSLGGFLAVQPAPQTELTLGAGLRDQEARKARPYVALGTSLTF